MSYLFTSMERFDYVDNNIKLNLKLMKTLPIYWYEYYTRLFLIYIPRNKLIYTNCNLHPSY